MSGVDHEMSGVDQDCIIIGAGFAGLRALIESRRRGLSSRLLEAGPDVGGTWYWNRYPGARTDSESWVYCLSFDDSLLQEWDWEDRFPDQPQVQRYLAHVADRFELRKDIDFNTRVDRIVRDDATNSWTVTTNSGRVSTCRYLILAVGGLSAAYEPPFPGVESFQGERYLSSRWPEQEVDFDGKRVGIIGTGATAVQLIPLVAQLAQRLTVFQRTANYVLPARNCPLHEVQRRAIKRDYPAILEQARKHPLGFPIDSPGRVMADVDDAERDRILERGWETGGFRYLFETFDDLYTNQEANDVAAEFVRNKIRAIVRDPATARLLCPTNHPIAAKRPPLGHYYYETYNRHNVDLVAVSDNPIKAVTEHGLCLTDGTEYELDVLIYATGFDAGTGALTAIDIRGSDGRSLAERWRAGAKTHLSVAVSGFPNMFMIGGPGAPFGNNPPVAEFLAEWVGEAISHLQRTGADSIEADLDAMDAWSRKLRDIIDATLLSQGEAVNAWFMGANVPGKARVPVFHMGGVPAFTTDLQKSAANNYEGFTFS